MTRLGDAIRERQRQRQLRKELERGYNDHARIKQDLARLVAREDLAAEQAWAEMKADGVPVADLHTEPAVTEPELEADL